MNIQQIKSKIYLAKRYTSGIIADQMRLFKGESMDYIQPCFWGRLGNLMFQLAACYAHGLRYSIPVRAEWSKNEHTRIFQYILGNLATIFPDCKPSRKLGYIEPHFAYSPIPASTQRGVIYGNFQSEKYFDDFKEEIFHLYSPFIAPKESNTLGICIRRGDYKKLTHKFNLMGEGWLRQALSQFDLKNKKLVLFSDEPKEALLMLRQALGVDNVNITMYEGGAVIQMQKLTMMENLIISASSFHWWGAYLGRCEKVVAPAKWFLSEIPDYQDIYLPHWTRI